MPPAKLERPPFRAREIATPAEAMAAACDSAARAAECYISEGPDRAMSKYNRRT